MLALTSRIDSDCEGEIIRVLLALAEGRGRGDELFDTMATMLLPSGSAVASKIMFLNMSEHFDDGDGEDDLQHELEEHELEDEEDEHSSDSEVAVLYYILLTILAEESKTQGPRVRRMVRSSTCVCFFSFWRCSCGFCSSLLMMSSFTL